MRLQTCHRCYGLESGYPKGWAEFEGQIYHPGDCLEKAQRLARYREADLGGDVCSHERCYKDAFDWCCGGDVAYCYDHQYDVDDCPGCS